MRFKTNALKIKDYRLVRAERFIRQICCIRERVCLPQISAKVYWQLGSNILTPSAGGLSINLPDLASCKTWMSHHNLSVLFNFSVSIVTPAHTKKDQGSQVSSQKLTINRTWRTTTASIYMVYGCFSGLAGNEKLADSHRTR